MQMREQGSPLPQPGMQQAPVEPQGIAGIKPEMLANLSEEQLMLLLQFLGQQGQGGPGAGANAQGQPPIQETGPLGGM